jgi:glycosyltransferase involved in cell wall biosynthesis
MASNIILHTPEPASSSATYIMAMTRALAEEGVAIHIVCPGNHQYIEEMRSIPMLTVHPTAARSTDNARGLVARALDNLGYLRSSLTVLCRFSRPRDIVHFQYPIHFPFGIIFFAAAKMRRCRIVYTVHDPVPHKWLLPSWLRWLERGSLTAAYRVSDILIVHSEPGKKVLIEEFRLPAAKIRVVVHGPYDLGRGLLPMPISSRLEVLAFGTLRENKGFHLAIEAVQQLHRSGVPVCLTIAGEVPNRREESYWEQCQDLIAKDPAAIRVIKGFIPEDEVHALLGSCHCVLLPYTRFYSDSGVAFLALANGRAIIATRAGGLGPLLDSAEIGIAIEAATAESVGAAIRRAVELGVEELRRCGAAGAEYVSENCGWPVVAGKTRKIYEAVSSL